MATVSAEAEEGGCDLNLDADAADAVLRWLSVPLPVTTFTLALPYTSSAQIQALKTMPGKVPGGVASASLPAPRMALAKI